MVSQNCTIALQNLMRCYFQKNSFHFIYLEDLKCLNTRCWNVTKIYSHCTFEQSRFKRDFVLMNQRSRQNAKNTIESFFKLMNNANFG